MGKVRTCPARICPHYTRPRIASATLETGQADLRRWLVRRRRRSRYTQKMMSLIRGEPDAVIRWAGLLILGGLLLGAASAWLKFPGVITAAFAISLGASGGTLIRWRTEPGLWMIAGLFLILFSSIYALCLFGQGRDLLRGAGRPDLGVVIDLSLGTTLLASTNRFLWRVAKTNWKLAPASADDSTGL